MERARVTLRVRRLHPERDGDLPLPRPMTVGAAGMDVVASVEAPVTIAPGCWAAIATGLSVEVPVGWELQVRPRSGLAAQHGVTVLNSPGTVDSDYRGELLVLLINHGAAPFVVVRGMRVAQLLLAPVPLLDVLLVDTLPPTERSRGGFGSTGLS